MSISKTNPTMQPESLFPGPRIVVVGVTASGKTTTSSRLARIFGIPHVELDSLQWLPDWVAEEREVFRQKVAQALTGPAWVVDGNYSQARDIIWARATTLVWLDYSLPTILWQLTRRSMRRMLTREELWNGNRETLQSFFLSKDSIFLWTLKAYPRLRKTLPQAIARPENAHLQVLHFHKRQETRCWLEELQKQAGR